MLAKAADIKVTGGAQRRLLVTKGNNIIRALHHLKNVRAKGGISS